MKIGNWIQTLNPRSDSFFSGLLYGIISFMFAWFLFDKLNQIVFANKVGFSAHFICILAVCFNILPFQIFNKQNRFNSMRGIVYTTILLVIWLLYHFKNDFFL